MPQFYKGDNLYDFLLTRLFSKPPLKGFNLFSEEHNAFLFVKKTPTDKGQKKIQVELPPLMYIH